MRNYSLILVVVFLLACNALNAPAAQPTWPPNTTPEKTLLEIAMTSTAQAAQVTATAESLSATAVYALNNPLPTVTISLSPTPEFRGFTQARLRNSGGEFKPQMARLSEEARALHQRPVAHFTTTDCKPCKAIRKGLEAKNPALLAAFEGVYLINVDVETWGWEQARRGFDFQQIPVFYLLDYQGRPTGEKLDLHKYTDKDLDLMIKELDEFFHKEQ